jgi:hypothetical protein
MTPALPSQDNTHAKRLAKWLVSIEVAPPIGEVAT